MFKVFYCLLMVCVSAHTFAGLNDEFIFSSKLGLSKDSVTSRYTSFDEFGFGGQLNGLPRDTNHTLFYVKDNLHSVFVGHDYKPDFFNSELEMRKWAFSVVTLMIEKATKKYGQPVKNSIICTDIESYDNCSGIAKWLGNKKNFIIKISEVPLSNNLSKVYNASSRLHVNYAYLSSEDYELVSLRLDSFVKKAWDRYMNITEKSLGISGLSDIKLEEFLTANAKMVEILRKDNLNYINGVKNNYTPEKFVRSFRLQ